MTFEELREKHRQFIYQGFKTSLKGGSLVISFDFSIAPNIRFNPEIVLPNVTDEMIGQVGKEVLDNLIFNIGMVELLSYWKATCSPKIVIKAGYLDDGQVNFWRDLLINGLGEFFYRNQIDFTREDLVKFVVDHPEAKPALFNGELKDRDLVLISGGKDSATTLGLIRPTERKFQCLMLEPTIAAKGVARVGGCNSPITIERKLDPTLLELNKQGYLNGHTPFSALLAFLSILCQILYDYRYGIVSDEVSSNEGNVNYLGHEINHQYSKSFRFEEVFREYVKKHLSPTADYFSILRPLKDVQIAALFSEYPEFHGVFRSCNRGQKNNEWCGECPKCLFTYMALYPFLKEKTKEILHKDVAGDQSLLPLLKGLIGQGELKPFECVGTFEENRALVYLHPVLSTKVKIKDMDQERVHQLYHSWNESNNLPQYYANFLKHMVDKIKL